MEEKLLLLDIVHKSCDERCRGMWESTTWKIYEDLTIEIFDSYEDAKKDKKYTLKVGDYLFEKLLNCINEAKQNNEKIYACDGEVWGIIQYEKGNKIWERECDYIYGIKPLEEVARILKGLIE